MNGSAEYNLGKMEADIASIKDSISNLTAGLGKRVEDHTQDISTLKANQDNHKEYLLAVNAKINGHIDKHWLWIGIMIGILSIGAAMLKFMGNK